MAGGDSDATPDGRGWLWDVVLSAWLVELLADAGREKLTTLVLGDAQERALRQAAAAAAVQDTAGELSASDSQRAGQIA
jgi:hypothetical protein